MKPNFALSLSFDGISLLLRAAGGWQRVGAVDVANPDLGAALSELRALAEAHDPSGIRCKLIIPDEQIRYLSLETGPLDDEARMNAAREALDGATPYPVDALVLDVSAEGAMTHVAAVARETLEEAEAFATEHAFNPVSFVAAPDKAGFLGEPFFGPTGRAAALLVEGDTVEPDRVRVVVVGEATPHDAEQDAPDAKPAGQDVPAAEVAPLNPERESEKPEAAALSDDWHVAGTKAPAAKAASDTIVSAPAERAPITKPVAAATPMPSDDTPGPSKPAPEPVASLEPASLDNEPEADNEDLPVPTPRPAPVAHTHARHSAASTARAEDGRESPAPVQTSRSASQPEPGTERPSDRLSGREKSIGITAPHVAPPGGESAPESGEALPGFSSRRAAGPGNGAALGGVTRETPLPKPPAPPPQTRPDPVAAPPKPAAPNPRLAKPPLRAPAAPAPVAASVPAALAEQSSEPEPAASPRGGFLSRRKPAEADASAVAARRSEGAAAAAMAAEAQRMTIFGARDAVQVGGKPRYLGLILTAILIVFLAAVAAWAAVFLDDGLARLFPARERTLASTLPEESQTALAREVGATIDAPAKDAAADSVELASLSTDAEDPLTSEDAAVLDALRTPRPEPVEEPPETLDAAALEARYAVTGIWPKAPQQVEPAPLVALEDLYVTGIDPVSPALDAVALPSVASFETDAPLAVVTSPVSADTRFSLGAGGQVIATVEGALSPDGHLVFLGRPPAVPPETPVRFESDPTDRSALAIVTQIRPRARPGDLVEQNERATLGGLSRSELAEFRPRLRPQALQEQEEAAQRANAPADAQVSALATAQSLRPQTRPSGFAQLVARATPSPASSASTASVAPAPVSVAPRTVTPRIPSSASVAREATTRNAINLRQVNLIGVYGTPSDRRALVRLANGRYRKVQVGDRIDGGQVSAIGDSELRYRKGSRNVVLKMPKG